MMRKAVILCLAVSTAVLAFAATSFAIDRDPEPRLRSNLPAAALPATALSEADAIEINNIVGVSGARAGIIPDSYKEVRLLTQTAVGPLYLIPGTRGVCLSLGGGSGCGDPGASGSRITALVALDSSGGRLVGGGIADASVDRVEVEVVGHGVRTLVPVTRGVFSIDIPVPGFRPGKGIKFIAH